MLSCLVYTVLTVILPLQRTYKSLKGAESQSHELWSVYWGFFALFYFTSRYISCLCWGPFELVSLLFFCWLYYPTYRGALVLSSFTKKQIFNNPTFLANFNKIRSYLTKAHLIEQQPYKAQ